MTVTIGTSSIQNYLSPGGDSRYLPNGSFPGLTTIFSVNARRGTRTGTSTASIFRIDQPAGGGYDLATKVVTGYGSFTTNTGGTGTRFNYPYAMVNRTWGLSIQFMDDQSANWDYNDPTRAAPNPIMIAASFDATGFQVYSMFTWNAQVTIPVATLNFSYTAWGN